MTRIHPNLSPETRCCSNNIILRQVLPPFHIRLGPKGASLHVFCPASTLLATTRRYPAGAVSVGGGMPYGGRWPAGAVPVGGGMPYDGHWPAGAVLVGGGMLYGGP